MSNIWYVADQAVYISDIMIFCEYGHCTCPERILTVSGLTEKELAYLMELKQPATWTIEGKYCGDTWWHCGVPKCITW